MHLTELKQSDWVISAWIINEFENCHYKIAAKSIANRLKAVISKVINNDQTGFLQGRFIGENIRLIDGIINHTAAHNIPG